VLRIWFNKIGMCNTSNNYCDYADINRDSAPPLTRGGLFGVNNKDLSLFVPNNGRTDCKLEPWRACELGLPQEEVSDGFDNDCDGLIDEEINEEEFASLSFWSSLIKFIKDLF
jgi:hypothetical protein